MEASKASAGATAIVAVVTATHVIVANCGDSRAYVHRKGVTYRMSIDHKPDRPDEQARILGMGGKIYLISLAACLKSHRDLITFEQGGFSSGESLVCGSQMSTCLAWRWAVASATAQLNR